MTRRRSTHEKLPGRWTVPLIACLATSFAFNVFFIILLSRGAH